MTSAASGPGRSVDLDRPVLITGGTRGIGLTTAEHLAASGIPVILTARDAASSRRAVQTVQHHAGPGVPVRAVMLDLASTASIRRCAQDLHEQGARLAGLVLNAGVNTRAVRRTAEGFELMFGVNHLGHYLLLHRLLALLDPPARVVVVTSGVHDPDTLDGRPAPPASGTAAELADPATAPARAQVRYSTSKLANLHTAYEFSRRLHQAGVSTPAAPITVNAFDPGAVPGTGLTREWSPLARGAVRALGALRSLPVNVHSVDTSAAALATLLTAPHLADLSGRYFGVRGLKHSSLDSHDDRRANDLFNDSAHLVALQPNETLLPIEHTPRHPAVDTASTSSDDTHVPHQAGTE